MRSGRTLPIVLAILAATAAGFSNAAEQAPSRGRRLTPEQVAALRQKQQQDFADMRKQLLKLGVPFEPNDLLDWRLRARINPLLEQMPEMHRVLRASSFSGIYLAGTLYVPQNVSTVGPTLVLVKHLVIEGPCVHFGADVLPSGFFQVGDGEYVPAPEPPMDDDPVRFHVPGSFSVVDRPGERRIDLNPASGALWMMPAAVSALGMSVKQAMKKAGLSKKDYPNGLAPFDAIRRVARPQTKCR